MDALVRPRVRLAIGVVAPLALVAVAYGLWLISDRLGYVGPLDRAAFGWLVVVPAWLAAPVAAGYLWRNPGGRRDWLAASVVGAVVGAVAGLLLWQAATAVDCAYGPTRTPADWILPSVILGVVLGGGLALSGLAATVPAATRRWGSMIVIGAGTELVMIFVAILSVAPFLATPGCNRPPG